MTRQDFQELAPTLPVTAGVYRFIAADAEILYIGKAKNLKKRLASYFSSRKDMRRKTKIMVRTAVRIEYTLVETEQDALLLEATLIKKIKPRYNVALKWTKPYPYICIKNERFPRVLLTHDVVRDGSRYFGPYTSQMRVNSLLDLIKNLFQLRTCALALTHDNIEKGKFKVCLEYHIKNCKAPCVGFEREDEYNIKIERVADMLKGNFADVKKYLHTQIDAFVENLEFERAHEAQQHLKAFEDYQGKSTVVNPSIKDVDVFSIELHEDKAYVNYIKVAQGAIINTFTTDLQQNLNSRAADMLVFAIAELREKFQSIAPEIIVPMPVRLPDTSIKITIPQIGDKKKLLDLSIKNLHYFILQNQKTELNRAQRQTKSDKLLEQMQKDLRTTEKPAHIECFDNSNLQGTNPVSAMVVFKNGKPSKRDYRHYNVKTVVGANDFATMEEIVYRRYKRVLESKQALPQLIVIDGGRGQLNAAIQSLEALGIMGQVQIIGIAKRLEEIYFADELVPLLLSKKSPTLKVIQQIRDEAHRFGISFHRDQRSRAFLQTELTQIQGIGEKSVEKLLTKFGSVKGVQAATYEELEPVVGKRAAARIVVYFQEKDRQSND